MNTSYNKNHITKTKLIATVAVPLKEGGAFPDLNQFGLEGTGPDIHGKVVIQKQNAGGGYFLNANQSGEIFFGP